MISKVFGHGKTHIPVIVRRMLQLKDGDMVLWEPFDGEIKIYKARILRQDVEQQEASLFKRDLVHHPDRRGPTAISRTRIS
ncbi:MAG: hypothetical protein QXT81_01710 [Candidatus Bathyarchaeia archaeon]